MSDSQILQMAADDLLFKPTDSHIRAKTAFWCRFSENPIGDPSHLTLATVASYVTDRRIEKWWSLPGFREWFCNTNEFREMLEMGAYKSLHKLMEIISLPTEPKLASAQVNAIKLLMEIGRKMPTRGSSDEKYLDEKISKMNKQELESYINKQIRLLGPTGTP